MSLSQELKKQLFALPREDIDEAWGILRQAASRLAQEATMNFRRGQKVSWDSRKRGETMSGVIEQINQRTITVKVHGGARWRVSADMLRMDEGKGKG
jgi:phage gpG-like protein